MFRAFDFCIPTRGTKVPHTPDWLHEIKYDGYRLRLERDGDRVRLITRNGYDWTKRYPWIGKSISSSTARPSFSASTASRILRRFVRQAQRRGPALRFRYARRRRRRYALSAALNAKGQSGAAFG